ncbi:MAG: DUF1269 domain-containing protein [Alteromonadaceae bacterium]|nr:DUF1269 domain-containing protein [Alteromonadaceae bacterium]|tara:strand:+ start:4826 stop:5365 length:540 start_codon:yes stop_codon:yes gene_type:complete
MQRLYFLVPDASTTVNIANELEALELKKNDVHVLAQDHAKLKEMGVNRATFLQTSDVINATKRGLIWGTPLGIILGAIAAILLDFDWSWTGLVVLLICSGLAGAVLGSWASSMIGVSVLDVKVQDYNDDIRRGAYLMLVDVPEQREHEISAAISRHHPDVVIDKITAQDKDKVGGEGRG